jgi:uncharacterized protein (DUF302 family)
MYAIVDIQESVMKKILAAAACIAAWTAPASASDGDIMKRQAEADVPAVMNALVAAVEGAGATVFARIDHAGGATDAGLTLAPSQVLVFGNPALGTPAMQDDPLAGLFLPMKVLVYEDAQGQVWLAYEDPEETLDDLDGIDDDAAYLAKMRTALSRLTGAAAGGE